MLFSKTISECFLSHVKVHYFSNKFNKIFRQNKYFLGWLLLEINNIFVSSGFSDVKQYKHVAV